MKIFAYNLSADAKVEVPAGSKLLSVQAKLGIPDTGFKEEIVAWFIVDDTITEKETVNFVVIVGGADFPKDEGLTYVATVRQYGELVTHVFVRPSAVAIN